MCKFNSNERIDELQIGGLKMIQAENGYRFSLDPLLLADFTVVQKDDRVVDLGTGSGVLPLLIAKNTDAKAVVGIEIQEALFDRALRNVELNGLIDKIDVRQLDVRDVIKEDSFAVGSFDVVVMNPPYRSPQAGRISLNNERAICRHELHGNIQDFLAAARYLVRQGGSVNVVLLAERLTELLGEMKSSGIEPKRLCMVHSDCERDAHLVMIEGRKGGRPGVKVQPPLYIYKNGEYSEEIRSTFGSASTMTRG